MFPTPSVTLKRIVYVHIIPVFTFPDEVMELVILPETLSRAVAQESL